VGPSGHQICSAPRRCAARRVSAEALAAVRDRMDRLALITITTDTYQRAGELDPAVPAPSVWP